MLVDEAEQTPEGKAAVREFADAALIGRLVRDLRQRAALRQSDLAMLCSIPQPGLSRIENGHHVPHAATLERLCLALERHLGVLNAAQTAADRDIDRAHWIERLKSLRGADRGRDCLRVGILAHKLHKSGPLSDLATFFKELAPLFARSQPLELIAVGGTARALQRFGASGFECAVSHLRPLADGRRGGVRAMVQLVAERNPYTSPSLVIYLKDPNDPTGSFDESIALERECAKSDIPFITTLRGAVEYLTLLMLTTDPGIQTDDRFIEDSDFGPTSFPFTSTASELVPLRDEVAAVLMPPDSYTTYGDSFVARNEAFLEQFREIVTTEDAAHCFRPDHATAVSDIESDDTHSTAPDDARVTVQAVGHRDTTYDLCSKVADGSLSRVLILDGKDDDYRTQANVLERSAQTFGTVPLYRGASTITKWMSLVGQYRKERRSLFRISDLFRELFGAHLVLSDGESWDSVARSSAHVLISEIWYRSRPSAERLRDGSVVTVGVAAGNAIAEIASRACGFATHAGITAAPASFDFKGRFPSDRYAPLVPRIYAPLCGYTGFGSTRGAPDRTCELLSQATAGRAINRSWQEYAELDDNSQPDAELREVWQQLDIALMTCTLPPQIVADFALEETRAIGMVAGGLIDSDGKECRLKDNVVRRGIRFDRLYDIVSNGGTSILAIGGDEAADRAHRRREAAAAVLNASLANVVVTTPKTARSLILAAAADW